MKWLLSITAALLPSVALASEAGRFIYSTDAISQIIVGLLLVVLFATLIVEAFHKTLAAAGVVALMLGITATTQYQLMDFTSAINAVDWNVIFLLGSMMFIVGVLVQTNVFNWLTAKMAAWAKGRPGPLVKIIASGTGVLSAFADNVTTVLFMAPVTNRVAQQLRISVWVIAMPMIMAANIGGTATLIGDPPNVIVGVAAGLPFMSFIYFLAIPVVWMMIALNAFSGWWYRRELAGAHVSHDHLGEVVELQHIPVLRWTLGVVAVVFVGFFTHSITHLPVGIVAFAGAVLVAGGQHVILKRTIGPKKAEHVFTHTFERGIEWLTLGFFIFLFMAISSAEHTGLIASAATGLQLAIDAVGAGDLRTKLLVAALMILIFSAVASALVDNIPYTIAAVVIVKVIVASFTTELAATGMSPEDVTITANVLWWALALGACLGGNGTLIGASANVTTVGLLEKDGHHMSFVNFLKFGVPVTAMTIVISAIYLTAYVYVGGVQANVYGGIGLAIYLGWQAIRFLLQRKLQPATA